MSAKPILKWAGGKRQLIDKLIQYMPKNYNNYYEPFVGGGALLFELMPQKAIINDVNEELLAVYYCMANDDYFHLLLEDLKKHEMNHSEEYYYKVREEDRDPKFKDKPLWERASRAIYLNKSCFNGLYRVNSKGFFNVPFGKKNKVQTFDNDNIEKIHKYFQNEKVKILKGDFVEAVETASIGDFIYFDPPYDPFINKSSFTSYTEANFSKKDQKRLADLFKKLTDKGIQIMLSNHNTEYINELYKGYNIHIVNAKRMINSNSNGRGNVEEVIITNY